LRDLSSVVYRRSGGGGDELSDGWWRGEIIEASPRSRGDRRTVSEVRDGSLSGEGGVHAIGDGHGVRTRNSTTVRKRMHVIADFSPGRPCNMVLSSN
jgi:hypothetical protein